MASKKLEQIFPFFTHTAAEKRYVPRRSKTFQTFPSYVHNASQCIIHFIIFFTKGALQQWPPLSGGPLTRRNIQGFSERVLARRRWHSTSRDKEAFLVSVDARVFLTPVFSITLAGRC